VKQLSTFDASKRQEGGHITYTTSGYLVDVRNVSNSTGYF